VTPAGASPGGEVGRKAPWEMLQRPLRPGVLVRVKVGRRRGRVFPIAECLTTKDEPAFITGAARYGVAVEDGRIADYARAELACVPRSRRVTP